MILQETIASALKDALKSRDELRLSVFRMLSSAIHNKAIELRRDGRSDAILSDDVVLPVIRSELKKRKDAAAAYQAGGRPESAARETEEANILAALLPQEISDEEIIVLIRECEKTLGPAAEKNFGAFMGQVMQRVKGQASGERVAALLKGRFGS